VIVPDMNEQGMPEQYIAIHTDITDIKAMEVDLKSSNTLLKHERELTESQKQKAERSQYQAEQASKAKSTFLSSMSHELRTPLNAILGFAQLLAMDALSIEQKESVDFITSGGEHLLELINDVLELSEIEEGITELSITPISLKDALTDALLLISPVAEKSDIKIIILSDQDIMINAHAIKFKQVLINLISNAIKYNRQLGSVTIKWHCINNNRIRISVTDTGVGISEDNQEKVFSAFNRFGFENSAIEGTGIGLVITKDLVEMMGGAIGFESIEHKGTTFWLEFPVITGSVSSDTLDYIAQELMAAPEVENKHILYVEDNPANSELVERFFKRQKGYALEVAITGEVAWERALQKDFDLIFMDINLPGMNGKELTQKLRVTEEYKHKPIIALTAAVMTHEVESAAGLFDDYLTKPLHFSELMASLEKHLTD